MLEVWLHSDFAGERGSLMEAVNARSGSPRRESVWHKVRRLGCAFCVEALPFTSRVTGRPKSIKRLSRSTVAAVTFVLVVTVMRLSWQMALISCFFDGFGACSQKKSEITLSVMSQVSSFGTGFRTFGYISLI